MRIEQVIARYGNGEYDKETKKRLPSRITFGAHALPLGCVDMLCLSSETTGNRDNLTELIAFTRRIPDDRTKEWVKNAFCATGPKEDALIEKLIIEAI